MMSNMTTASDFYEDDEPIETIKAAFARGTKFLTQPPQRAYNECVKLPFVGLPTLTVGGANMTVGVAVPH